MGKVNAQLLTEKSETVLRCLQRVRQKKPTQLSLLLTDIDAQDIIVLNLERAVQVCVEYILIAFAIGKIEHQLLKR